MTWTDARMAELARLWAAGVSASGIAEALGDVSRGAVLGKLHRLKLLRSRKPASAPRRYDGAAATPAQPPTLRLAAHASGDAASAQPPAPPKSPWREAAFAPLPGATPRPWLTREAGECAFPVGGEGIAVLSCCAPTRPRSAYCEAHHGVVFKAVSPGARAAEERQWIRAAERCAA
jgi:GcrA cell cycle regulator